MTPDNETRRGATAGNGADDGPPRCFGSNLAGSVSPDGTDPASFSAWPWIEGEGVHRLKGVDWQAVADGEAA